MDNGGCEEVCNNDVGGYFCSCAEGETLYLYDGFNGFELRDGEDGTRRGDVFHFNHTCVCKSTILQILM